MKTLMNTKQGTVLDALRGVAAAATAVDVAVSYVQASGWRLFREATKHIDSQKIRVVCTDQLAITHPQAIRDAVAAGVQLKLYNGDSVFHPKVFLAKGVSGTEFVLGSANLSESALLTSVEVVIRSDESASAAALQLWFDELFHAQAETPSAKRIDELAEEWKRAAAERLARRMRDRRERKLRGAPTPTNPTPDERESLEDVFSTLEEPIGLLSFDYAGNTVRSLATARRILSSFVAGDLISDKQRSEISRLGFLIDGKLTKLGKDAASASTSFEVARLWCQWLRESDDKKLQALNYRLPAAKRVFSRFWQLNKEVRDFFLENAENPSEQRKKQLMTIELLCNASDAVTALRMSDIDELAPLLRRYADLPKSVREAVRDYVENKGARTWKEPDRILVPRAWNDSGQ